jgi:hypothetical protein
MFAKVKPQVFIDTLTLELSTPEKNGIKALLRDESGVVCRRMEAASPTHRSVTWNGLNDLPYGVYTLEVQQGDDEMQMRLIKRV